tara:strand:+ start:1206 stop:1520 length:315 start_codon:yes stop_codon:yes gene_type:complete
MTKLLKVLKSKNKKYKYTAYFLLDNGKEKKTNFGAAGMSDYLIYYKDEGEKKAKERRELYRKRHAKDLRTNDPTRAGYLSYYLLWGDTPSLGGNIKLYKKRFNL